MEGKLSSEGWVFYYKPLNILVNASTFDECVEDFQEEFFVLYEAYAKEADENLTKGAKRFKMVLLDMMEI